MDNDRVTARRYLHPQTRRCPAPDVMAPRSRECVARAVICVLNVAIGVESFVAVVVFDRSASKKSFGISDSDKRLSSSLLAAWILIQYAAFGASVVFAAAVWIARATRALVLLANALFFALYGVQWIALAICMCVSGYTTTAAVFAALALHPLVGFLLSRSAGRRAREDAERQEALEIVFEHEDSRYYANEV